ncbi:hypothetical protein [Scytonema sp. UIC 10036]|nr:hypothetical protein [Scytonema sp. UIC 10036]
MSIEQEETIAEVLSITMISGIKLNYLFKTGFSEQKLATVSRE